MKKNYLYFYFLFLIPLSTSFCQSLSLGLKLESLGYTEKYLISNTTKFHLIGFPLSGYLKASINFNGKYEAELKGGIQLGDTFVGPEYAIAFKYNVYRNILPLITYMKHFNSGNSRTGEGTYSNNFNFLGVGVEAKLTKLFCVNLIYYLPVGEKGLDYQLGVYSSNSDELVTTTQIGSMIKLGFIFNIIHF